MLIRLRILLTGCIFMRPYFMYKKLEKFKDGSSSSLLFTRIQYLNYQFDMNLNMQQGLNNYASHKRFRCLVTTCYCITTKNKVILKDTIIYSCSLPLILTFFHCSFKFSNSLRAASENFWWAISLRSGCPAFTQAVPKRCYAWNRLSHGRSTIPFNFLLKAIVKAEEYWWIITIVVRDKIKKRVVIWPPFINFVVTTL